MKYYLFFQSLSIFLFAQTCFGQGLKGVISDENGLALPYTSIYNKEKSSGTTSNADGYYELKLAPGEYEIVFQFMGYDPEIKKVKIGNDVMELNVSMTPQNFQVNEVTIVRGKEDPAYTIMRKAIAKSKYHLLQCDRYDATVYTKGTGQVKKIPGVFKKMLEDEGVDTGRAFTSESVMEIYFERPNKFGNKIISIRASGEDDPNANPGSYISSSFYQPNVMSAISPLSPSAFRYYKFQYLGTFLDRGFEINKIKVIPRSPGENVFEGEIYIREDFWSLYSLNLQAKINMYDVSIEQIFAPVLDDIWMPVTQKYKFEFSLFGFYGVYDYFASVQDYIIVKNGELDALVNLVDEKVEEAPEKLESIKDGELDDGLDDVFDKKKSVSNKQFFDLIEDYEKSEIEKTEEKDVLYDYTFEIDSAAKTKDSLYWADIRSVPLTEKEKKSYVIDDSIYMVQKKTRNRDSLRQANGDTLGFADLFFGGYYKISDRMRLSFPGFLPNLRYNTVEGVNLDFSANIFWKDDSVYGINIKPYLRYSFSSNTLYPKLELRFGLGKKRPKHIFQIEGGKYINQFSKNSINPFVNSLYSLLLERNYMRLYEKEYVRGEWSKNLSTKYSVKASVEWANRNQLFNNSNWSLINWKDTEYFGNEPLNREGGFQAFTDAKAFTTSFEITAQPWLKYRKYNGHKFPIAGSSPIISLRYFSGWKGVFESSSEFQRIEASLKSSIKIGAKATLDFEIEGGSFLYANELQFVDHKHFQGLLTEFAPLSLTGNYRLLDYYNYSTSNNYISALSYIRFRKLFITQIPSLRLLGVKENFFVNYLKSEFSPNYTELGYTVDNILNLFRLELIQSFEDSKAKNFGFRIGISASIGG